MKTSCDMTRREKRFRKRILGKDSKVFENMLNLRVNTAPMLSDEKLDAQNDKFPGNEFDWSHWTAERYVNATEIRNILDTFHLVGRKIWNVWTTSHDFFNDKEKLEDTVYSDLADRLGWTNERVRSGSSIHALAKCARIPREMEIDTPFILEFDSRETLEIDVDIAPTYRISMNRIPNRMVSGKFDNVDPMYMLSPIVGRTITAVELLTVPEGGQDDTVNAIILRLDNGFVLKMRGFFDFLDVDLLDRDGKTATASMHFLRNGFFNYQDLHFDPSTGFEAKDSSLWFGWKGKRKVGSHPVMVKSIVADTRGRIPAKAFIDNNDALGIVLGLCALHPMILGSSNAVELSADEWIAVLEAGQRALSSFRLSNDDSPIARLLFETPPPANPSVWYKATDEERMRIKRDRCQLCLSETLRWTRKAIPSTGKVQIIM